MKDEVMKGVGSNVTMLGVVSFLTDISSEMIFPILPIFLTAILGAGKEVLGLIEGAADSVASLVEIFSGYWADRTGKRKDLVIFGYGISSLVKVGIALSTAWWHVLIMRSLERVGKGIRTSPRDAIIAASSEKGARGKAFGFHRMMDTVGAIIGPLLAYGIFAFAGSAEPGYRTIFLAALIPAFLAVLVILLFVKEPAKPQEKQEKKPSFWESLKQLPQEYKSFLKISLLFSLSYFSFAFFIVRASDLGVKPESVVILYVIYNIVYAAASIPIGMLSDSVGRKKVIAGAFALYALVCVGFALATDWLHFALLFAVYGIFVAADESVNKAYISDISQEGKRGMALGAYNTAIGAAYLPASVVAGAVWASFGAPAAFSLAAVVAFVSAFAFFIYRS